MSCIRKTSNVAGEYAAGRWHELADRVLQGHQLTAEEGLSILRSPDEQLLDLLAATYRVRRQWWGNQVRLNFLINAKSGACAEDCGYCSQSRVSKAEISRYALLAARSDSRRRPGCLPAQGQDLLHRHFRPRPRQAGTRPGRGTGPQDQASSTTSRSASQRASWEPEQAQRLKQCGVDRVNHNLNTSRRFYPQICTTHTFQDRLDTLWAVRKAGMEICSGGIVGMGEEDADVVELALELGNLGVEALPVNFFTPIEGTPVTAANPQATFAALLPEGPGPVPAGQSALRPAGGGRPRIAPRLAATAGAVCGQFDVRRRLPDHPRPAAERRLPHDRGIGL